MIIKTLIKHLKQSEVGKIYWHNLCLQYLAGMINKGIARQVFQRASMLEAYREAIDKVAAVSPIKYNLSYYARQALYETSRENMYAISASDIPHDPAELPTTVSTVISDTVFARFCVRNPSAFSRMVIAWMTKLGPSPIPTGPELRHVFADMISQNIKQLNNIPDATETILQYIVIRTRYSRFWMAGDPSGFPSNPDDIRDLFGLGHLKKGEWLIRISVPTSALFSQLGKNSALVRRPSAFCVNDDSSPRFRGVTRDEYADPTALASFGTTIRLDKVELSIIPDDGEREWICPEISAEKGDIRFDLLGAIANDRSRPTNADYQQYLKTTFPLSVKAENTVIDDLAHP